MLSLGSVPLCTRRSLGEIPSLKKGPSGPTTPISGVGFALVDDDGKLSGNVTTYLRVSQTACGSLAFALSATGSIDAGNRVVLAATDGIVSFIFDGALDSTRRFFSNSNYTVTGSEAYPLRARLFQPTVPLSTQYSCAGTLKGQLLPALGTYSGILETSNGGQVEASHNRFLQALAYSIYVMLKRRNRSVSRSP
jgi:hypothetical protein